MEVAGKVAIVTGSGGRGSGRAIAQRLAHEGASVVISDINEQGELETVRSVQAKGGRARFFLADVGHESEVRSLITFAEDAY
jgi:NAD(P)-dependent dehydrogenase (short-subunit alcohol dehydrogenase family)